MIQYYVDFDDKRLKALKNNEDKKPCFTILDTDEFKENLTQIPYYKEFLHSLGSIRYCKAELYKNCVIGTLRLPQRNNERKTQLALAFYLNEDYLLFVQDFGDVKTWTDKRSALFNQIDNPTHILLQFMEQMIDDDVLYLSHIENEMEKIENEIIEDENKDIFAILTKYRQKLSELFAYYQQLIDISELFQSRTFSLFNDNKHEWDKFTQRVVRLQNHVQLLRENTLQLRELYNSKQDSRQNKIMGILTIVTTFFLPLTLITGWYGMNFTNMPELKWRYGYPTVIIVALIIAISEFIYFKRKKFF